MWKQQSCARPSHVRRTADAFARQLYLSMLAQALIVKSAVEVQRSENTWGTVLWQARLVPDRTPIRSCYPAFTPQSLPCAAQRDLADGRLGVYRVRRRRPSLDCWPGSWRSLEASAGGLQEGPSRILLLVQCNGACAFPLLSLICAALVYRAFISQRHCCVRHRRSLLPQER